MISDERYIFILNVLFSVFNVLCQAFSAVGASAGAAVGTSAGAATGAAGSSVLGLRGGKLKA